MSKALGEIRRHLRKDALLILFVRRCCLKKKYSRELGLNHDLAIRKALDLGRRETSLGSIVHGVMISSHVWNHTTEAINT